MAVMQSIVFASAVILVLLVNEGELKGQKIFFCMRNDKRRMILGANNFWSEFSFQQISD